MTPCSLLRRLRRGRPIAVVSGLPRSGTSMAMAMLEAGGVPLLTDRRRTADAHNPRGYFELEQVKGLAHGADVTWLAEARGRAVKIVSFLVTYLPETYDYRVIFMRRPLAEVIASQAAMLEARSMPPGAAASETLAIYEQHLAQVDRFLARRACFSTLPLDYPEVLADPHGHAARLAEFLGRRLDVARMAAVADATLHRQRAGLAFRPDRST